MVWLTFPLDPQLVRASALRSARPPPAENESSGHFRWCVCVCGGGGGGGGICGGWGSFLVWVGVVGFVV
eukprot:COSAG02_NODE_37216_length_444_cov_17.373913_2_plen_68_part_01